MLHGLDELVQLVRRTAPAFKRVDGPSLLTDIQADMGKHLPCCVVLPGQGEIDLPEKPDWRATAPLVELQSWLLVLLLPYQARPETDGLTERDAGRLMAAIVKAVHGYGTKRGAKTSGFLYAGRPAPEYLSGYCEFYLGFMRRVELSDFMYEQPEFFQDYGEAAKTLGDEKRALADC